MRPLHRRTLTGHTDNKREETTHAELLARLALKTGGDAKAEREKHRARRRDRGQT